MTASLRPVAAPFVAAAPAGARVRARLRLSAEDAAVLRAVGGHLGSLAGRDLAARCAQGRLDAAGRARFRAVRKRALTAESSSRWAGAITRTSEDAYRLAGQNLRAERASLTARIRRIQARLAVQASRTAGTTRGYPTAAERHAKTVRVQTLQARLGRVQRQLDSGTVSVVRGGKALLRKRNNLAAAGLTPAGWRREWESSRLFLTADGEKDKAWGNETIRWHPEEGWLEVKLPAPLARLANRPHGRYRLSCPVGFSYRGDEVAAQAATGAVRYDISYDPARGRWYLDASWKVPPAPDRVPGRAAAVPGRGRRRQPRPPRRRRHRGGRQHPRRPGHHSPGPGRAAVRHPRRAPAGGHQQPDRDRPGRRCPRHRHRGPRLRPGPRRRTRTRWPAGPRAAGGAGPSGARSPGSPPASSATGWSRWPATRACRSSSSIPPTPPAGQPSTGCGPCGNTTPKRPVTTRQRW